MISEAKVFYDGKMGHEVVVSTRLVSKFSYVVIVVAVVVYSVKTFLLL